MALAIEAGESVLIDGAVYRALSRAGSGDLRFQDFENGNLLQISEEQLQEKYLEGNATFGALGVLQLKKRLEAGSLEDEESEARKDWQNRNLLVDFASLRPEQQAEARRAKAYIDAIIVKGRPAKRAVTWPPIIDVAAREIADSRKPSWQTVSRWLRRYLANRCDLRSLLSGNSSKGRRRTARSVEEREVLEGALQLWLTEQQPTKQWVYDQVKAAYLKARRDKVNATKWKLPCRATVFRMLNDIDEHEKVRRREGKRAADYLFDTVGPGKPATFRLEVVEIDHTRADVWVIDHVSGYLLGRPWITIAIDRFTRMIVGVYIGFEPPSTHSVMQCIHNMINPKLKMLKEMGVQGPWNPFGAPVTVMVDNAQEFLSDSVRSTLAELNITIAQQPVNRPEFKGIVERAMRTIKEKGLTWMPGKVRTFAKDSHGYDPEKSACISLDEFRKYFFLWLIFEYTNTTHSGIMDVPGRRWEEEVARRPVWIPNHVNDLAAVLGLRKRGIISRRGIRFRNLFYQSPELTRIRMSPKYENEVQYTVDPGNLGSIRVIHPAGHRTVAVPAVIPEYANGLTLAQHNFIRAFLLKRNQSYENRKELVEGRQMLQELSLDMLKKNRTKNRSRLARAAGIGVTQSKGETQPRSEEQPKLLTQSQGEMKRMLIESDRDVSFQHIVNSDFKEEESPTNPDLDQASNARPRKRKSVKRQKDASAQSSKAGRARNPKEKTLTLRKTEAPAVNPDADDDENNIESFPVEERTSGRRPGPQ